MTVVCGVLLLSGCVMAEKYDAEKARSLKFATSGGDTIEIQANQAQQVYDARLSELLQQNPKLRELPAFRQLQAAGAQ